MGMGVAKLTSWMTPRSIRAIHCKMVAKSMLVETNSKRTGFNIISNKEMHNIG